MNFPDIGLEMADSVESILGIHPEHDPVIKKIDAETVEVNLEYGSSELGEPFDVSFMFRVSKDHKSLVLVDAPNITNSNVELFGQDIINNYMRNLRGNQKIERIDMTDEGDNSALEVTLSK